MARPERNTVDYFPFLCEEGKKMFYIEETYGNDGFAVTMKLLRELAKTDYHYLYLADDTTKMYLAAKCKVSLELLEKIISDLVRLGKFNKPLWDKCQVVWCQDFIDSIQDAYQRRNNECMTIKGLLRHLKGLGILKHTKGILKDNIKPHSIEKDSIVDKSKEDNTGEFEILDPYPFMDFWDKYDKKRGDREKIEKIWDKLSVEDRQSIMEYIPLYITSQPDKKYRKDPQTFLNNKSWNDELINQNNNSNDKWTTALSDPDRYKVGKEDNNLS